MKFCHSFKSTVWFNDAIYSLEILGNVGLGDGFCLIGDNPIRLYCQLQSHEQTYWKWNQSTIIFIVENLSWKYLLQNDRHLTRVPICFTCHLLKGNVVILTKFSSLATQDIVKITTSRAASDANLIKSDISGLVMHYSDVIMSAMVSQITSLTIAYSTVYSGADQRKQSSASLAFVRGIHRWPVNSPRKWPETRKMFPLDDAIMAREDSQLGHSEFVIQWNDYRDFYVQTSVSM